jgi:hypothetical protein
MSVLGTTDASLDIFGGLVTDVAAADLPPGASPDCGDVAFLPGAVKTRPGLLSQFAAIAGNPTINYVKTYIQPNLSETMLALDSAGSLWGEFTPGTLTQINTGPGGKFIAPNCRAKSSTLFGREYIAFHDGRFGLDIPRQYDGTNFDRVSQVGPGAGPVTAFDATTEPVYTVGNSPTGAVRNNNVATITTTTAHNLYPGASVLIAGVVDASFNGTFVVQSVPSPTTLTYQQLGAASNSGGSAGSASATLAPLLSAGVHQVCVFFQTRQGYLTQPSPPVTWTASGGRRVQLTGIPLPLNDANVVGRVLAFTPAGGGSFYYTSGLNNASQMIIADTSTTSVTLDFSDTALLAGTLADPLFRLVELGECAGVIGYASRLFWWGERNKVENFRNLSFDGGFVNSGAGVRPPLGWTSDNTYGGAGLGAISAIWGGAWEIIGDNVANDKGMITQSAYLDSDGVPIIRPNVGYSVRLRAMNDPLSAPPTSGNLHIHLYSASQGIDVGFDVAAASLTTQCQEFTGVLTSGIVSPAPADLLLRVYADGLNFNCGIIIDNIEIYPTAQPYSSSIVRASRVEDPESYDGVDGLLSIAENNGQAVRAGFILRDQLYFVKEHSIYSTRDDGVNEPADWTLSEVSNCVGTPSVDGVDTGEDWAVIADRAGLFIFDGGEPVKISQEIQPLWDTINWQYGHTLWVRVDTRAKRILVGVPIAPATQPNRVLALDYRSLSTAAEIATYASVHSSSMTGRLISVGRARKWAPWNIAANCAALIERSDGTAQFFLGNGAGTGKIYQLSDTQFSDDGAAIAGYYTTYFVPSTDQEGEFGVRAHRKLFSYMTCYAEGAGNLNVTSFADNEGFPAALPPLALSAPGSKDLELSLNVLAERVAFQVGTNQAGSWFRLSRLVASLGPDPWSLVRGGN